MMKKKAMAYWSAVCPGCNIGRKYPKSFIGKRVVEHWEKGCHKNSEKIKEDSPAS
jgi:hypothetical protein